MSHAPTQSLECETWPYARTREVFNISKSVKNNSNAEHIDTDSSTLNHFIKWKDYEVLSTSENHGYVQKFRIKKIGLELSYRQVLDLWESDEEFTDLYSSIFKKCGFDSYVWETPPISTITLDQVFEFVILNTPRSSTYPDTDTFDEYFDPHASQNGVVSFLNLGHDAMLVVPSPLRTGANYSGLAEFFSEAPVDQQRALWKVTSHQIKLRLSKNNTWVSVAGGGISWLHVRLDKKPKYYRYMPYTNNAPNNRMQSGTAEPRR